MYIMNKFTVCCIMLAIIYCASWSSWISNKVNHAESGPGPAVVAQK
jgi:hypothetical protein